MFDAINCPEMQRLLIAFLLQHRQKCDKNRSISLGVTTMRTSNKSESSAWNEITNFNVGESKLQMYFKYFHKNENKKCLRWWHDWTVEQDVDGTLNLDIAAACVACCSGNCLNFKWFWKTKIVFEVKILVKLLTWGIFKEFWKLFASADTEIASSVFSPWKESLSTNKSQRQIKRKHKRPVRVY